jgi:hypothetical protein
MPHFQMSRPRYGVCYLDFVEVWLFNALYHDGSIDNVYKYARELGHWALLMHPELAPMPHNIVLGEN